MRSPKFRTKSKLKRTKHGALKFRYDANMSTDGQPAPGSIMWMDISVPEATALRDFYSRVVGWEFEGESMGDYEDYSMIASSGEATAGICHARGENAQLPPQWLIYIVVADLDTSLEQVMLAGGRVVDGPREMGGGRFACIQDSAGAVCGLYQLG